MRLKNYRLKAGMSQKALAEKVGVKQSTVAMWENGTNTPCVSTLIKLAALFECSVDELVKQ